MKYSTGNNRAGKGRNYQRGKIEPAKRNAQAGKFLSMEDVLKLQSLPPEEKRAAYYKLYGMTA